ncbi:rifin [Plasmodium reichenowi]|uniref:Rifin n=1 Tax=Plasmodium reichenowi TaxID=5854 RepID=A0A060RM99_PLARE|nr:rifin [Plasmodium reichenowi]
MKVHYINLLLFSLPLNILINDQRNHKSTTSHTPKIPTTRSLCECELYAPANYDSNPEMKRVMQQFEDRSRQRFHEYDEHMKTTRQKCKEKCDKEIQKIILKDKIDKELTEKLSTLKTDIQSDAIPTCICEKSLADKMEKGCLRCGYGLGTVAPTVGLIKKKKKKKGAWKNTAIAAATKAAIAKGAAEGLAAGETAGRNIVIKFLKEWGVEQFCPDLFTSIGSKIPYNDVGKFADLILTQQKQACSVSSVVENPMCRIFNVSFGITDAAGKPKGAPGSGPVREVLEKLVEKATGTADHVTKTTTDSVTATAIETNTGVVQTASYNWYTTIGYSVLAILIIVLIMVIIYLVLRYRRKKKMKKKLQYIKLFEE